jgi:DNA-binding MarR family transcriptional regulator
MATRRETEAGGEVNQQARRLAQEKFMDVTRALVRTFQQFEALDKKHVRSLGLTRAQFDVLATLGNTPGMRLNELARKTLITKSSLTGVLDRMESRGWLRREVPEGDRRCFRAVLTPEGQTLFDRVFPEHLQYIKRHLGRLSDQEMDDVVSCLGRLREVLASPEGEEKG